MKGINKEVIVKVYKGVFTDGGSFVEEWYVIAKSSKEAINKFSIYAEELKNSAYYEDLDFTHFVLVGDLLPEK